MNKPTEQDYKYKLNNWFKDNQRFLPWRENKDPYRIWISEIILQQTQVKQGLPYFLKFMKLFPNIHALAQADEKIVLKTWEGLGYYSRARNLHATAKYISKELNGIFPKNYKELIKLKGVGDYTASAISSIAYGEAVPTIDGNVNRVISRLFDINKAIDSKEGKEEVRHFLLNIFDNTAPGNFNQAMMELGALICRPSAPNCQECPLETNCLSLKNQTIQLRPIKKNKLIVKTIFIDYLFIWHNKQIILKQRDAKGIWKRMFEFPQKNFIHKPKNNDHLSELRKEYSDLEAPIVFIESIEHKLTHRNIKIRFFECELINKPSKDLFSIEDLEDKAMPKPILSFLKKHFL